MAKAYLHLAHTDLFVTAKEELNVKQAMVIISAMQRLSVFMACLKI